MSKQLKEKIMKYGELLVSATTKVCKTWKTIKLGTGLTTAADFCEAIHSAGMNIDDWANDILGKPAFTVATSVTEVDLVVASVAELGFKDGATREDIYVRAKELGLDLCPPEVGPQLRLQYTDQPKGEWLVIAMESITDSEGNLDLFLVKHDDCACWFDISDGNPYADWFSGSRFVFRRRK
jgi:hypothetical protein